MAILAIQILNSLLYASVLFLIAAGLSLIFGAVDAGVLETARDAVRHLDAPPRPATSDEAVICAVMARSVP